MWVQLVSEMVIEKENGYIEQQELLRLLEN